ncbi:hypothetical protein LY78DRAFT_4033 [Colletotrichum sublineola]|nr:hypothetical protein LY78DRAFT_4033 [Colletotrichum sublineola]
MRITFRVRLDCKKSTKHSLTSGNDRSPRLLLTCLLVCLRDGCSCAHERAQLLPCRSPPPRTVRSMVALLSTSFISPGVDLLMKRRSG